MTDDWSRRRFLKGAVAIGGVALTPALLGGCEEAGFGDTLAKIKETGVIKVGFAGERPYAYDDNGLVGAIPAVHRAIFERIGGIELKGIQVPFRDLTKDLNSGAFDVIAAGMFVTPGRCTRVAFAEPTYCSLSSMMVSKGNPLGLSDYRSVAAQDARLAVLAGAVERGYALAAGVPENRLTTVRSQGQGLEQLATGEVDAFTLTSISLRAILERAAQAEPSGPSGGIAAWADRVELVPPFVPMVNGQKQLGCGAAGFRRTDDSLLTAFNRELAALQAEGAVLELMQPYGFTAAEMPESGVTTEMLCSGEGRAITGSDSLTR